MLKVDDPPLTDSGDAGGSDMAEGSKNRAAGDVKRFSERVYDYYMDMWKLFYASYLVLPIIL